MWFVLAVVFTAVMVLINRSQWNPAFNRLDFSVLGRLIVRYFLLAFFIAAGLTMLTNAVVIVPAGHRGVIFDRIKGLRPGQLNEGMNFVTPFIQEATLLDVRVQKVEFAASAASKDLQSVQTKVALNFSPIAERTPDIFKEYGLGYMEKVVHPAVQEAVKAATARYTAEELVTKREDVKKEIHTLLSQHMEPAHLRLMETYITDFDFSAEFAHAIEAKQIAEQGALKARRDLDRIKIEAEQKVAQARAEADGLRLQREAITPQLLELRRIEAQKAAIDKWNGVLPATMMGEAVPFIQMGDARERR